MECYDGEDMSWRFKNEMKGGDRVNVCVELSMNYNIPIKKCGVHLLYQRNDPACFEIKEPAMFTRGSKHHRRLPIQRLVTGFVGSTSLIMGRFCHYQLRGR